MIGSGPQLSMMNSDSVVASWRDPRKNVQWYSVGRDTDLEVIFNES
jgi:hypothetical protein